ncbi:hypothetical protein [Bdellovibrio sp. HCB337]|uniref:hypothetical protein n=1 Tax=Bdellovibrio sp. HCB337 TaxID=3394358 RepID=UPI0039A62C34
MKTQTTKNKMMKVLFGALAAITVMTSACSKNSSNNTPAVPPPIVVGPGGCAVPGCIPGGGQFLYGGTTINGMFNLAQAQFQVTGDMSGNGPGSITGVVTFNNYLCQMGVQLTGQYQIQMMQQGSLAADVFTGNVTLIGGQGSIPAGIQVVPTRTQGTGLFSLYVCNSQMDMNF